MDPFVPGEPGGAAARKIRRADFPPWRTPEPAIDPFPYRSKPLRGRAGKGRDPWPMRSKMPDVGWLINSKYPRPSKVRAQAQASPRFEPEYFPEPEMPVPEMAMEMEMDPFAEPGVAGEPAPRSRRRDPYRFERSGRGARLFGF